MYETKSSSPPKFYFRAAGPVLWAEIGTEPVPTSSKFWEPEIGSVFARTTQNKSIRFALIWFSDWTRTLLTPTLKEIFESIIHHEQYSHTWIHNYENKKRSIDEERNAEIEFYIGVKDVDFIWNQISIEENDQWLGPWIWWTQKEWTNEVSWSEED